MTLRQLIGQVGRHGYAVTQRGDSFALSKTRPDADCPAWLVEQVRERREEIIAWLHGSSQAEPVEVEALEPTEPEQCRVCCGIVVDRRATGVLCPRVQARAVVSRSGGVVVPESPGCPYRR